VSEFDSPDAPEEADVPSADKTDVSSEAPIADDGTAAPDETASSASDETPVPPAAPADDVAPEPEAADVAPEPVAAAEEPAEVEPAEEGVTAEEPAEPEPVAAEETVVVVDDTAIVEGDVEEVELVPRQKPEIPGADLIPDIVPEGEEFLDAESQAAAEAEREAAAAREAAAEAEAQPIADAAIDLAAGARYTATGKRKTAVARVILKPGTGTYSINGRTLETAFPRDTLQRVIRQPLEAVGYESRMDVVARMHGGGVAAQAGALRHGISRALLEADPNLRGELKRRGFLTRDPRVKERKKAGLKKARKRPQFSKR
jgi:small subunit ribosomal protein S9